MSLIHEALKKAEQEGSTLPKKESASDPILPGRKRPPLRTVILLSVLGVSLAFLFYMRLLRQPQTAPAATPIQAADPSQMEQNPQAMKQLAAQMFEQKKYEASAATWEKLTLLLPTDAEVYNNLGVVLRKLGRKEEALQAYTRAIALKEAYPEALNNLGTLYLAEGQRAEAKRKFQQAAELAPDYAAPYFHLGLIAEQEGNTRLARQNYETFLEKSAELDENLRQRLKNKIELFSQ